jgi:hypothetical protein
MASGIDDAFIVGYKEVKALYDTEKLPECVKKARELIADPAIPRYHHMLTLIILASILEDWNEAKNCLVKANGLWYIIRRGNLPGQDKEVDKVMDKIWEELNKVEEALRKEEVRPWDLRIEIFETVETHDLDVAAARESIEDLHIHIDERLNTPITSSSCYRQC